MGNILDKINNPDINNPFTNQKKQGSSDAKVLYSSVLPQSVIQKNIKSSAQYAPEDTVDPYIPEIQTETPMVNQEYGVRKISDNELIDTIVKQLKGREDYMDVISQIIYRLK